MNVNDKVEGFLLLDNKEVYVKAEIINMNPIGYDGDFLCNVLVSSHPKMFACSHNYIHHSIISKWKIYDECRTTYLEISFTKNSIL